jgi:hypothetical protein
MGKKLTELEKAIRVVESTMGVLAGPGSAHDCVVDRKKRCCGCYLAYQLQTLH